MEFTEVIRTRRSVRSFAEREVSEEVLGRVMEAARVAPSGNNRQPWRFVVVRDTDRKQEIAEACYAQGFVAEAPIVIVCCSEPYENSYEPWGGRCHRADTMIAIDHLVLAARDEGLGTCWVGAVRAEGVREVIRAPEGVEVLMVIVLGYPASDSAFREVSGRKPIEEIRFFEEYGRR